jgi:hypothetical protein
MPKTDPRVDEYIAKAADFARPILREIRARVHEACPACEETMKWSTPAFDYKGALCGMGAFKAHCLFGFWKAPLVVGGSNPHGRYRNLRSIDDLPSKKETAAGQYRTLLRKLRRVRVLLESEWLARVKPARGPHR